MGKRIALHNLGCKVNAYELDEIAGSLLARGHEIVPFTEDADIYIVNTCTVTNIADRKSRQMLHRAKKKNPEALVVALGCYVDTDAEGVKKDLCIDIALGNKDKAGLAAVLEEYESAREDDLQKESAAICAGDCIPDTEPASASYRSRTRAYLKIQDGCNLFCSYCIIPFARGRSVSRLPEDVLCEARAVAAQGVKEVVLTGIHISSYGLDFAEGSSRDTGTAENGTQQGVAEPCANTALTDLIRAINDIPGIGRIRLGSLEPRMVTAETVAALKSADKLCPHFHLSLQSGCDAVLQRMRRRYTTEEFENSVALLREAFENPAITTDIIVGFPGETDAEFAKSREFVERISFYETHVFPYSARKGTTAAKMEGQLTQKEKAARADVLLKLTAERSKAYREHFLEIPQRVLWEEEEAINGKTYLTGHTERYVKVAVAADGADRGIRAGEITTVTPHGFLTDEILLV